VIRSAEFLPSKGHCVAGGWENHQHFCLQENGETRTRISIFLNVFDVHVNRSPVNGVIEDVQYRKGKFRNAMDAASADLNEQNVVTVRTAAAPWCSSK